MSVELALARVQLRARQLFIERVTYLPRRLQPHHFLWVCAIIPVVIVPPLVSLILAIGGMRRSNSKSSDVNFEWIAIVSMLNVILSALFLYRFHFSPTEIMAYLADILLSFIREVAPYTPIREPPAKLTPVWLPI